MRQTVPDRSGHQAARRVDFAAGGSSRASNRSTTLFPGRRAVRQARGVVRARISRKKKRAGPTLNEPMTSRSARPGPNTARAARGGSGRNRERAVFDVGRRNCRRSPPDPCKLPGAIGMASAATGRALDARSAAGRHPTAPATQGIQAAR